MERWGIERAERATAIVAAALPGEDLSLDELVACCWEDPEPSIVVGHGSGGVASAVVRSAGRRTEVFVQLVAVEPAARGTGVGRALLGAIRAWAVDDQGAAGLRVGGSTPFSLLPGIDRQATAALSVFAAAGYRPTGDVEGLRFPTRYRAAPPAGVVLRRALDDADGAAASMFAEAFGAATSAEVARAVDHGTCHLAWGDEGGSPIVAALVCHSVNRLGWLGPTAVAPAWRGRGVGSALLGAVAAELMAAGLESVEVPPTEAGRFFEHAAGAVASRKYRTLELRIEPDPFDA